MTELNPREPDEVVKGNNTERLDTSSGIEHLTPDFDVSYDFHQAESKWQGVWEKLNVFQPQDKVNRPYFVIGSFPHPTTKDLHIGHVIGSIRADVKARFMRLVGYDVLHPTSWDSFGNHAVEQSEQGKGSIPEILDNSINYTRQTLQGLGLSSFWENTGATHTPQSLRCTQQILLTLYDSWVDEETGTVRPISELHVPASLNQDPERVKDFVDSKRLIYSQTVQEADGSEETEIMLRSSNLSARLLTGLKNLDWPTRTIQQHSEWLTPIESKSLQIKIANSQLQLRLALPDENTNFDYQQILISNADYQELASHLKTDQTIFAYHPEKGNPIPILPASDSTEKRQIASLYDASLDTDSDSPLQDPRFLFATVTNITEPALRDFKISRKQDWGEPLPFSIEQDGKITPLDFDQLPLLPKALDDSTDHQSSTHNLTVARKLSSSWGHLLYSNVADRLNKQNASDGENSWQSVDSYFMGADWAIIHLMYARLIHTVLHDRGYVDSDEAFQELVWQPLVLTEAFKDSQDQWISSQLVREDSKGNYTHKESGESLKRVTTKMSRDLPESSSVNEHLIEHGADVFRLQSLLSSNLHKPTIWSNRTIAGAKRSIRRLWVACLGTSVTEQPNPKIDKILESARENILRQLNRNASNHAFVEFNKCIKQLKKFTLTQTNKEQLVALASPFMPHVAEEIWERLGAEGLVSTFRWSDSLY